MSKDPEHDALIQALCDPAFYDHNVESVDIIQTHISWILLAGETVYKIKKTLDLGFLDYSTLQKRKHFCYEELRLNQRLAPELYQAVVPITGSASRPIINGNGDAIEYAVKMRRFPTGQLLSDYCEQGSLRPEIIDQLAKTVADFHRQTAIAAADSPYGKTKDIQHWFQENFTHIRPLLQDRQSIDQLQKIQDWGQANSKLLSEVMRQRKLTGFVRECHGDLHLGNLVCIDNRIIPFDCIEFNPQLRWIDVCSEIAFVMMDLLYRGHHANAYRFLNQYLQHSGDYLGLHLLHYYLIYRALVRAKICLLGTAQQTDLALTMDIPHEYQRYINLIENFMSVNKPVLIITHGYSGSGKSFIAEGLAESVGSIIIRSDVERKRLSGLHALENSGSGINRGLYTQQTDKLTYLRLANLATASIKAGFTAIVDAAFLNADKREQFRILAQDIGVEFFILDIQTPPQLLRQRLLQRRTAANDASEATLEVLQQQFLSAQVLTEKECLNVIVVDTCGEINLNKISEQISAGHR